MIIAHSALLTSPGRDNLRLPGGVITLFPNMHDHYVLKTSYPFSFSFLQRVSRGFPNISGPFKMVEKRRATDNVRPDCQQMQVPNNWQTIAPIQGAIPYFLQELEGNMRMTCNSEGLNPWNDNC